MDVSISGLLAHAKRTCTLAAGSVTFPAGPAGTRCETRPRTPMTRTCPRGAGAGKHASISCRLMLDRAWR